MSTTKETQSGRWIYCRSIRLKNGKVIYPKTASFFRFWVTN